MLQSLQSAVVQMNLEFLGAPKDVAAFPQWMGVPMSVLMLSGIAFAYRGHGLKGLSVLMVYISALIAVQLSMKQVLQSFPFPMFMSLIHFIATLTAVTVFISNKEDEDFPEADVQKPEFRKWFLRAVVPACICQYLAIAMNNVSLVYIGAGINAMIGLATPVVTAMVAAIFGMRIAVLGWVAIALTVAGDAVITMDGFSVTVKEGNSTKLFLYGVILSVIAMGTRGAKTVLQDKLMNNYGAEVEERPKLSPLQSWFLQGPVLICLGLVGTVIKEGTAPWIALPWNAVSYATAPIMLANITSAVCLNISVMFVIKMLGAPAAQIAGKFHVLIVAALSCALMGETLTVVQAASTVTIIAGAALFEKAQSEKINDVKHMMASFQGKKYDATEQC